MNSPNIITLAVRVSAIPSATAPSLHNISVPFSPANAVTDKVETIAEVEFASTRLRV